MKSLAGPDVMPQQRSVHRLVLLPPSCTYGTVHDHGASSLAGTCGWKSFCTPAVLYPLSLKCCGRETQSCPMPGCRNVPMNEYALVASGRRPAPRCFTNETNERSEV